MGGGALWHEKAADEVLNELKTDSDTGLSTDEAASRLRQYGPNEIRRGRKVSPFKILASQFNDFLIYILLAAAVGTVLVRYAAAEEQDYTEVVLILTIVAANGLFGFVQDYRAEKAMEALHELSVPETLVLRNGEKIPVPANQVVPGDIILLEEGDRIPADARLIESQSLETMEAVLTGESAGLSKTVEPIPGDTPLAERSNMVFMSTDAVRGRGRAVIVATGMSTEVGAIAAEVERAERRLTPFQREIDQVGRRIGLGALGVIAIVGVVQYFFTGVGLTTTILVAVTLAVAAVPEGLPAIVTLTLAMGSHTMAKQNAVIRRLSVVESLGSVDVIVTDKTGTLTENQMTVKRLFFSGEIYEVTGEGTRTEGEFLKDGRPADPASLEPLLRCGAISNDAEPAPESQEADYYGEPTEVALLVSAAKAGIRSEVNRIRDIPFSSDRKRMTVIAGDGPPTAYMKGAPEYVVERSDRVWRDGQAQPLDDEMRQEILRKNSELAASAFRILACASKEVDDPNADEDDIESGMVFLGLQAMIDPPRADVREAIADCRRAGIKIIMVTGDNPGTAKAVGEQIGFSAEGAATGADMENLSDEDLEERMETAEIFARFSSHHKVRLLRALQKKNHRVAMTGDGVNDAPALRNADVGVAMGRRGTEVAKEASDMVLQDDNFVTLKNAIAEGRGIFDNIRKFVTLLLSANAGEVLIVFAGVLVGSAFFPSVFRSGGEALILTPLMLLWINVVTDGLPALALGADPKMRDIMHRPPRPPGEPVIDRTVIVAVFGIGIALAGAGLPLFFYIATSAALADAQSSLFTFIVVAEMAVLYVIRSRYRLSILSNRWLLAAVVLSLALQAAVLYTPLGTLFEVVSVSASLWRWIGAAAAVFVLLTLILPRLYPHRESPPRNGQEIAAR